MVNSDIIKDQKNDADLTDEQKEMLTKNTVGDIELSDEDLADVSGGVGGSSCWSRTSNSSPESEGLI